MRLSFTENVCQSYFWLISDFLGIISVFWLKVVNIKIKPVWNSLLLFERVKWGEISEEKRFRVKALHDAWLILHFYHTCSNTFKHCMSFIFFWHIHIYFFILHGLVLYFLTHQCTLNNLIPLLWPENKRSIPTRTKSLSRFYFLDIKKMKDLTGVIFDPNKDFQKQLKCVFECLLFSCVIQIQPALQHVFILLRCSNC